MADTWWDDFSNNLATDLAPLVALFGESPTKQYLSECLTIEDIIIFAVAPLGVITAVVSAIRVCGTPSLRAFVGRAQEGAGNAEAELCSSTSRDVCELYSNGGIARVFGRPKLLEIVHDPLASHREFYPTSDGPATSGIYSFQGYRERDRGKREWILAKGSLEKQKRASRSSNMPGNRQTETNFAPNPNLSLNIGIKPHARSWFIAASAFGIIMQSFVLVWAAVTRYHYRWLRNSHEDDYAIPLTVFGTILLCFGVALCASLIESKTREQVYEKVQTGDNKRQSKMYWVQPGNQTIGDQVFDSFAYSDAEHTVTRYTTSWKDESRNSDMNWIWTAVVTTATGFVCQFLGLRACHSSVPIAQLGVTLIMSFTRAGLRTQRLKQEENFLWVVPEFFQGHELDALALKIERPYVYNEAKPAEQKQLTDWEDTYSSELHLRRRWKIFSPLERSSINPTVSPTDVRFNADEHESHTPSTLERLLGVSLNLPILHGFSIKSQTEQRSTNFPEKPLDDAEEEVFRWTSMAYCLSQRDCAVESCEADLNPAAKAVFYRSRLARMTGLGEPESEQSSYWGTKYVYVRNTALTLANAIESTMDILFAAHSQKPVKLHESWEHAYRIFWTVRCCLVDPLKNDHHESDIHLSLRRETDEHGAPEASWKCDASELESVLSLWLWSLKEPGEQQSRTKTASKQTGQRISRILSTSQNSQDMASEMMELGFWQGPRGVQMKKRRLKLSKAGADIQSTDGRESIVNYTQAQNALWWKDDDVFVTTSEGPPQEAHDQRRFFGWCNAKANTSCDFIDILEIPSEDSLLLNCAQELYAKFLVAIMGAVDDIGGVTESEPHRDGLTMRNTNIDEIMRALLNCGLCDADGAFACTIPALRAQGVLEPLVDFPSVVEMFDRYKHHKNWNKAEDLTQWIIARTYNKLRSDRVKQDPTMIPECTNGLRLSLLSACEVYRQSTLKDDDQQKRIGYEGILALLERYSRDEAITKIPLVWLDCGLVPDGISIGSQSPTLAKVIQSYGEAIMLQLSNEPATSQEPHLYEALKNYIPKPRSESNDLCHAIKRSDLSFTLYLLGRRSLVESIKSRALLDASRKGWYTVVMGLLELGGHPEYEDETNRDAFSYAAEFGDINMATLLLKNAHFPNRFERRGESSRLPPFSPLYYAAKQGHAVIIREILKKHGNAGISDEEGHDHWTPLSCAIRSGNIAAVRAITEGAHTNDLNHWHTREPALHLAIREDLREVVDELLSNESVHPNFNYSKVTDTTPLVYALKLGNEPIFLRLLNHTRVDAEVPDPAWRRALWWAAALGRDTFVRRLLDSGKVSHFETEDKSGYTALSLAVELGHLSIVRQLLDVVDVSAVSWRAIYIAAKNGHTSVVGELLPRKMKDKDFARRLLCDNDLEDVWCEIQNSTLWKGEVSEGEGISQRIIEELKSLPDSEFTKASNMVRAQIEAEKYIPWSGQLRRFDS